MSGWGRKLYPSNVRVATKLAAKTKMKYFHVLASQRREMNNKIKTAKDEKEPFRHVFGLFLFFRGHLICMDSERDRNSFCQLVDELNLNKKDPNKPSL
jgi:hypothetical protein